MEALRMLPKPQHDDGAYRDLIGRIARRRDREAFSRLFELCQVPACSLALRITGRRATAEEAVQEAMLRVWKAAPAYRAEGSARAWVLRIVARESLRIVERSRRDQDEAERQRERMERGMESPMENAERAEQLTALRSVLDGLPDFDRRMVALYYGGGMSQEDIGQALALPQQTVSKKLTRALELVRERLAAAGFAAALPLANAEGLHEAATGGAAASPALYGRVMAQAGAPAAWSSMAAALWAIPAVALAGIAAWWMGAGHAPPATPNVPGSSNAQPALDVPEQPAPRAAAEAAPAPAAGIPWQPLDASVKYAMYRSQNPPLAKGPNNLRIDFQEGGDAKWKIETGPEGTNVLQGGVELAALNVLYVGPWVAGAHEWTGTFDYSECAPDNQVALLATTSMNSKRGVDPVTGGKFCMHAVRPDMKPVAFRVVAWRDAVDKIVLVCFRSDSEMSMVSALHIHIKSGTEGLYILGFATNTRIAFRNLRIRKLPEGWTPQGEPGLLSALESWTAKAAKDAAPRK